MSHDLCTDLVAGWTSALEASLNLPDSKGIRVSWKVPDVAQSSLPTDWLWWSLPALRMGGSPADWQAFARVSSLGSIEAACSLLMTACGALPGVPTQPTPELIETFGGDPGEWTFIEVTVSGPEQGSAALLAALCADKVEPADSNAIRPGRLAGLEFAVQATFGRTTLLLGEIARMAAGTEIDLGSQSPTVVELRVNHRLVAVGEVVVLNGKYGVSITSKVAPERAGWAA
jgi:flagellar motor switch/type III secretory pathway protein FliN